MYGQTFPCHSGQKQRCAGPRSLVTRTACTPGRPEPFGALDALTRIRMHALLLRLVERTQPTVILVTHDVDEALLLADHILIIKTERFPKITSWATHPRRPDHPRFMQLRGVLLRSLEMETV